VVGVIKVDELPIFCSRGFEISTTPTVPFIADGSLSFCHLDIPQTIPIGHDKPLYQK